MGVVPTCKVSWSMVFRLFIRSPKCAKNIVIHISVFRKKGLQSGAQVIVEVRAVAWSLLVVQRVHIRETGVGNRSQNTR